MDRPAGKSSFSFHPLTPERWDDFALLFGPRGACAGCWCMFWKQSSPDFNRLKGSGNRAAMRRIVTRGEVPGILAYEGETPVGWCAVAPREAYPRLDRSRVLKRIDEEPVWSIVCFFVARTHRRRGLTVSLLKAAVAHARKAGAKIVEGYPVEPRKGAMPDVFAYTGLASAFLAAGFEEAARRSPVRPIMRIRTARTRAAGTKTRSRTASPAPRSRSGSSRPSTRRPA